MGPMGPQGPHEGGRPLMGPMGPQGPHEGGRPLMGPMGPQGPHEGQGRPHGPSWAPMGPQAPLGLPRAPLPPLGPWDPMWALGALFTLCGVSPAVNPFVETYAWRLPARQSSDFCSVRTPAEVWPAISKRQPAIKSEDSCRSLAGNLSTVGITPQRGNRDPIPRAEEGNGMLKGPRGEGRPREAQRGLWAHGGPWGPMRVHGGHTWGPSGPMWAHGGRRSLPGAHWAPWVWARSTKHLISR